MQPYALRSITSAAKLPDLIEPLFVGRQHLLGRHRGHARLSDLHPGGVVGKLSRLPD